ncbi:MAG: hypothetical protein ACF8AM_04220 [Rhodopirellula sp. JB055]|uniref:hypothetical protein n=1 Tax=Rhodopirellula sp. JB055 TaxID=3342846 RepID=UPI00370BC3C6
MRSYLVVGFISNAKDEPPKQIHFGTDRAAAIAETKKPSGMFLRKELHELAVPYMQQRFDEAMV